ncbi:MAG TPA: alpha/beta fold hydrolase [Gemmatimonadaceae bacterium]|jgi:carboxylesterase
MLLGLLLVIVVIAAALRERRIGALTALSLTRRRLGPNGIVIGGDGFTLERENAPAVLLIHGAGDTPQTLRYLGEYLHQQGFHVEAPLLPGHGRSVRDFRRVHADNLTNAARGAYVDLRARREWVGIIGLSMGGALAVQVAGEFADLPALGLAAPYLEMPRKIARAARLAWLWGPIVPIVESTEGLSIFDPDERAKNLAYGIFTASALAALYETVRRASNASRRVMAPTLVVQSREDNRISPTAAERSFAKIGATEKRLEWVSGASHVITVDFGREHVFALLASWLQEHGAAIVSQ